VVPPFDLTLSEDVRLEWLAFLKRTQSATISLMKAARTGELAERWHLFAHGTEQLKELTAEFARLGLPLLHEVAGMVVAIPQPHLLSELRGRMLTRDSTGLVVVDRDDRL
jgi:hypothetical protein